MAARTPTAETPPTLIHTLRVENPATPIPTPTREVLTGSPQPKPACFEPADLVPIAFMPDSTRLAMRTEAGVQIYNLGEMAEEAFIAAPGNILGAALSPDGEILAWSLADNSIQLLRIANQEVLHNLEGHTDVVNKLRFTPGGERLVSASHDGSARVWDMDGELQHTFQASGQVLGIGISPDGSQLATIEFDGPVRLWDLVTYELKTELDWLSGYDTSDAVFSSDGRFLAADLATGLYLWRVADGTLLWNEIKNSMAVAYSPDGRYLAYSNIDKNNEVVLSSPDGSQVLRTLEGIQSPVWELIFSPDGSKLVARDGVELRVWQVDDGVLLAVGVYPCP